jgi:hypothetical protein
MRLEWWWRRQRRHVLCHHAREGNDIAVAGEDLVFVGLGCLQDLLEEGLLIIASCYDRLIP